ncbi:PAS domain-containing protein [Roseovarius sp. 2305UL8-3]|uniref:PAS domain-containing protein n=1 Tax=Roseovarius conchicola TaxID=3121636 RepID=UPI003527F6B3
MDSCNPSDVVALGPSSGISREKHLGSFVSYWQSMRKMGDVPRRSDIDPRGIEPLLENALIVEKIAPGLARMRIAGSQLSDLMGMEVRGMPLSAFIEPAGREELADLLADLFERPAILDLALKSPSSIGRPAMTGRLVLLPLRSDLGDISRALGCFITDGVSGRVPRRFRITNRTVTPVTLPEEACMAFAEAPTPFEGNAPAHPSERPYLRLVK